MPAPGRPALAGRPGGDPDIHVSPLAPSSWYTWADPAPWMPGTSPDLYPQVCIGQSSPDEFAADPAMPGNPGDGPPFLSSRRRPGSMARWAPAFAGVTRWLKTVT